MNNEPSYFGLTNDHTWLSVSGEQYKKLKTTHRMKCCTHPVKELTDEEIIEIAKDCGYANRYELNIQFARAILRKAQEK